MSFQLCFDENNSTFFINDIQQEENVPETNSSSGPSRSSTSNRGRKRTLDNLSWEERVQRKKMKNRVAAQVSRDRKKAKFESMEQSLLVLKTAYEYQTTEFNELKKNYSKLQKEYTDLRRDFENFKSLTEERTLTRVAAPAQPATQPDSSNGSAASKRTNPLPKGQAGIVTAKPTVVGAKTAPLPRMTDLEKKMFEMAAGKVMRIVSLMSNSRNVLKSPRAIRSKDLIRMRSTLASLKDSLTTIYRCAPPTLQLRIMVMYRILRTKFSRMHKQ
uniref:X-box-binding protein 1 n=1 Tax=Cuerna arida TaxID=1464854 RepID=A0A1B6EY20_9HEMI